MTRTYAFVDGAAFEYGVVPLFAELGAGFEDINWNQLTRNADRIFYFDALPTAKGGEDPEVFNGRLEEKQTKLAHLQRVPNMHVRLGFTRVRENAKRPAISQKGVDIALAVEVLLHAHLGNIEVARLFLNDLDFFPLLESLTNTRVKTELFYLKEKTAKELFEVADVSEQITHFGLFPSLPERMKGPLRIESGNHVDSADAVLKRNGNSALGPVSLWYSEANKIYYVEGCSEGGAYACRCVSEKLLLSHFESIGSRSIVWASTENHLTVEPTP